MYERKHNTNPLRRLDFLETIALDMKSTQKKIELLAPGGDLDSIKAAIIAGADAVYCGLNRFNARNRAENIAVEDRKSVV